MKSLIGAAVAAALTLPAAFTAPATAGTGFPSQCATTASPYNGSAAALVYAQHGVAVRRYTKPGLSPMFIATAPLGNALPEPIFAATVNTRPGIHTLVAGSHALVGVNGDFFHIGGDNLPNGVQVGPGDHVIKGTSRWQNAAITTTAGHLVGGQVKVDVVVLHGTQRYVGSAINDPAGMQTNGLAVFTSRWGKPTQPLHSRAGWREYVVNSRGVVVAQHTAATATRIPVGGYIVEAQGASAVHLQVQGWRVNAHVQLRAYAHSNVPGGVYAAEGSGRRLVHNRAADIGACGYDTPTTRTVVGMIGAKTFLLATSKGRGLTLRETMAVLRWIGTTEAVMFDGGGSVEMADRARRLTTPLYGVERGIPSAWGLVPR